jgi:hypothetical protein
MGKAFAQDYWKDWVGFWGYVITSASEKFFTATVQLEKEEYGPENLFSDVFAYWNNLGSAYTTLLKGSYHHEPIVFVLDEHDECSGPKYIKIFAPSLPNTAPSSIWVEAVQSVMDDAKHPWARLTWRNIEVGFEGDDRTRVYVKLVAIKKPLAPGTYRTVVRMGEVPIAEVLIVVQEKKSFTAEVTRVVPQGPGGDRPPFGRGAARSRKGAAGATSEGSATRPRYQMRSTGRPKKKK